jgi:hypothetical protein
MGMENLMVEMIVKRGSDNNVFYIISFVGSSVIGQEGNQIMFSCEHNKFLGFWFLFSMAVNFLHVNDENYSIIVC